MKGCCVYMDAGIRLGINMENHSVLNTVELATELTIAWLSNPNTRVQAEEVPAFLSSMHAAVDAIGSGSSQAQPAFEVEQHVGAVSPRKSLADPNHILSMIDGKPYKALRRHLKTHGLTPDEYRSRYGLRADYPMVAQNYSEQRRAMAHKIGLGRKPRVEDPSESPAETKTRRGRGKATTAA